MAAQPRDIQRYITLEGRVPFDEWYDSLQDSKTQYKVDTRLERVELGNLGDYRSVGKGVLDRL